MKEKWIKATDEKERLKEDYKGILLQRLADLNVDVSQLEKYDWYQLETMLKIELGEQVRRGFDGEKCPSCGLVFRRYTAFTRCPRCGR